MSSTARAIHRRSIASVRDLLSLSVRLAVVVVIALTVAYLADAYLPPWLAWCWIVIAALSVLDTLFAVGLVSFVLLSDWRYGRHAMVTRRRLDRGLARLRPEIREDLLTRFSADSEHEAELLLVRVEGFLRSKQNRVEFTPENGGGAGVRLRKDGAG